MKISTSNLNESTKYILVHNDTNPVCVIELPFKFLYYSTTLDWIDTVKCKLEILARRSNYEYNNLSAEPINIINTL